MNGRVTVPAERLTAADLRDYLRRVEEAFAAGDQETEVLRGGRLRLVLTVNERIKQLEGVLVHVRDPHYSEAMELVGELKRARVSRSVSLPEVLERLRVVIAAWDADRQARRRAA